MAYLCLECNETYKMSLDYCPKTSCNGVIIEVDELMLPIIMLLNNKGYITEFCCSGHICEQDNRCYPYITFDSCLNDILSGKDIKSVFSGLPEPWYIDDDDWLDRISLRCSLENNNIVELQKHICYVNLKLLEFVDSLPLLYDEE